MAGESALDAEVDSPRGLVQSRAGAGAASRHRELHAARTRRPTAALRDSPYSRAYRLALELTAGEDTTYDAVKAVENYLQRDYRYSERPPSADLPLAAFLFEDKIGYCQQFSGAMALLLRMSGIPVRVAAGFSPGSFNRDSGEYRVRDLDAHSWVEVYFEGIGWVPFDPTPTAAPAESQSSGFGATSAAARRRGGGALAHAARPRPSAPPAATPARATPAEMGEPGGRWRSSWLVGGRRARARSASYARAAGGSAGDMADAQLAELRRALVRLGFSLPAATTLLGLERRLGRSVGPAAARYAAALRAHRFDPRAPEGPGLAERRALRRELSARGGLSARVRGLLAIPPGGPRPL